MARQLNKESNTLAENFEVFKNEEFCSIRTMTIDGEPWFVGKDVATALGYAKPENAISTHVNEEDKTSTLIQGSGTNYKSKAIIINESGLYALIFGSKLESAKRFKHWVTSEVLPSIRKNGGYIMGQEQMSDIELMSRALLVAESQIRERDQQISQMQPLADFAHHVHESDDLIDMGTMAQYLCDHGFQIGRNTLFRKLRELKVLKSNNMPYQNQLNLKRFVVKEYIKSTTRGAHLIHQTCVTGKGQRYIYNLLVKQTQS